eukprot:Awhi_evm1s10408
MFKTGLFIIGACAIMTQAQDPVDFKAPQKLFITDNSDNTITTNTTFETTNGQANGPGGGLMIQAGKYSGPPALASGTGNWPSIDGMGFSIVSFVVNNCGVVAPHVHSNAHEFNTVIAGEGIVGSYGVNDGQLYLNKVTVGDSFVFPQGSVHFWVNTGEKQLTTVGGFSASLPTAALVAGSLTGLPDTFIEAIFTSNSSISGNS